MVKKIHYCWFGGKPLPKLAKNCIKSWRKYCPLYEIVEWNETNFDIESCAYVREAYMAKKWAFVSDYARFKILYDEGGIYFDTDVEIIRSIDDIIEKGSFMGCEEEGVNPGLGMYVTSGINLYKEILDYYEKQHFIRADGSYNLETVVAKVTRILKKYGFNEKKTNEIQSIAGINIYPEEYFCPMRFSTRELCMTEKTRTIHHYDSSWFNEREVFWNKLKLKMNKFLPARLSARISFAVAYLKYEGVNALLKYMIIKRQRK